MPKLPIPTAQGQNQVRVGQPGTLNLPTPNADSYGAGIGQGAGILGQALLAVDERLQEQRDRLDLSERFLQFRLGVEQKRELVLSADEITWDKKADAFGKEVTDLRDTFMESAPSSHVRAAFQNLANQHIGTTQVGVMTDARKIEVGKQLLRTEQVNHLAMDEAAKMPTTGPDAMNGEVGNLMAENEDRLRFAIRAGIATPEEADKIRVSSLDRYWSQRALYDPRSILQLVASGRPIEQMDNAKMGHYLNIALGVMDRASRENEKRIKEIHDGNDALLTAELLSGGTVTKDLPAYLLSRSLDPSTARTLQTLEHKLRTEDDATKVEQGLAGQYEDRLRQAKYQPNSLDSNFLEQMKQDYILGKILKSDYTHLYGLWTQAQDAWKAPDSGANREITRAHANLVRELQTHGPMDKFDNLTNDTIAEAERFFWQHSQLESNPWAVHQEAVKIFKPVVQDRKNIEGVDKARFDDARMQGLLQRGAISRSAFEAWNRREQEQRGLAAVQKAIEALPPPVEPSLPERIKKFFKGKDSR